ncbi:BMP family ABC transporter substrate-binding protein [Pseudolysinimonas kribbensis]|uniref:BMP family ABC transporter substrate-binding protein n=1 Tax=Pseudolysinimonas kribbensis TaxID=433641 RepID=A0ABQ6K141_9MICO|nr:BMP family ABC transporter substrate-binding protein [Pseudolysinimonas kribbensis]GMA94318.1 BMP family ABC transporter substrate-binding protein [Pseudolysinimonas kribbensis]
MTLTTRKAALGGLTALAVSALTLVGCSAAPTGNGGSTDAKSSFLPCMVSDDGGFDDHSFNQLGLQGLESSAKSLGIKEKHVQSNSADDYTPNINSLLSANCNLIVTVGFNLSQATDAAAKANPDVKFAIVDDGLDNEGAKDKDGKPTGDGKVDVDNGKPILFDTVQAAFLGGYAAASYSKTGVVGTFGGLQIPPVTIFMDGFAEGVKYFNQQKGKDVKVVGWNVDTQTGVFTGGFAAGVEAKTAAQGLLDQNADVLMPVGGPIYQSAAEAIKDQNKGSVLIGVDADVFNTDKTVDDIILTSVQKGVDAGVEAVVKAAKNGDFDNTPYVGTLKNGGVKLAPFHNFESKVDPGLAGELKKIEAGIEDGSIKATSKSSPQQ